jgi:hypothetical protein
MSTSDTTTAQALELKALELLREARQREERAAESHKQSLREEIQFKNELIILLETHRHEMAMSGKLRQD